jgi:hypothetical protein
LKEWSIGQCGKINFSEDVAKQSYVLFSSWPTLSSYDGYSYARHLGNWNKLAENASKWAKHWKKGLLNRLLYELILFLLLYYFVTCLYS